MIVTMVLAELRRRKWFIFWWAVGLAAFMALILAVYPPFRHATQLNNSLNHLPDALKSLISDTNNYFSPVGYLSSQALYLILPILFSILTIGLGSSLLARDEQDHTLELILARPVSRATILAAKAVTGLTILAAVTGVTVLVTILGAWLINLGISFGHIALGIVTAAIMALLFGSLAFALAAIGSLGRVISIGVSCWIALLSYLLTSLAGTVHWLRWPAKFLPYNYYHPATILNSGFTWRDALGMAIAAVILYTIGYLGFRNRDIN